MLGNNILIGAAGAGGADAGHIIEGSGLFDGSSGHLTFTPGTPTDNLKWTYSWVGKLCDLAGTDPAGLNSLLDASTGDNDQVLFRLEANTLRFYQYDSGFEVDVKTNQVFRDPAAYYHIVLNYDSANATAGERLRIYVNGARVTSFGTATYPTLNLACDLNKSGATTSIGRRQYGGGGQIAYFDGYLANVAFIDGQALDPTSFGEVTDDGFWQINDASELTFGNNGFLLEGGSAISAGTDSSSNASTTAVDVTSAASIWDGSTGSFNLANDDIICTGGDKAIFTKTVFTGVVDLEFTGVGEWSQALFGFSKYTTVNNAGAAAGGVDGVEGISIYEHSSNATKFSDWSNTNAGNGSSPTATITRGQIAGETCNLIRQENGTVIFKIGGSTVFTGSDTYTGPIRVWVGSHGDITPPLSMTTVSITASGTAGNIFRPTGTITATNDSPTNDSANGYGNLVTINPLEPKAGGFTLSNGNKTYVSTGAQANMLATFGATSGKFYWEVNITALGAGTSQFSYGIAAETWDQSTTSFGPADTWYLNSNGSNSNYANSGTSVSGIAVAAAGDVMQIALDLDNQKLWFGNDDTWYTGEPDNGSTPAYTNLIAGERYIPIFGGHSAGTHMQATIVLDEDDWTYTVPTGFTSLSTANLPTPAIINPEEHFYSEVVTHNGTSTASTCTFNLDTYEWLAIIKNTTGAAEGWYMIDSLRGVTKVVFMNTTAAETTDANVLTVSGTTFTLGSTLGAKNYLVEFHKAGLASATASNTEGSLNTTATSVNLVSGFAISTYTGTGSNTNYGHGLNSAPEWTITKLRVGSTQGNYAWHVGLGAGTKVIYPHLNNAIDTAASIWNSTVPSATLNSLGTGVGVNTNTYTYVNWSWHSVEGYSAFGSYTGNGNTDGPVINLGGSPKQMTVKATADTTSWFLQTTTVDTFNEMSSYLQLNATDPLGTGVSTKVDYVSNGVKARWSSASLNAAANFIYMAYGIQPLTDGAINQVRADGRGSAPLAIATGGTITLDGDYAINTFNASGTLIFSKAPVGGVEYLVIAGGGGGGANYRAGGGGGGGYRTATGLAVEAISYAITVGAGGAGGSNTSAGTNGGNSIFSSITSAGGGGGGAYNSAAAKAGGSGGGSAGHPSTNTVPGAASPAGQGHAGGDGFVGTTQIGGGGGGAGAVGFDGTSGGTGGDGGAGLASSITGSEVFRAGGGGAGAYGGGNNFPVGGVGGGANGIHQAGRGNGPSASANTGGGGGGSSGTSTGSTGGTGGSGVVIIRYKYQ